jgi:hypothetical protein
MTDHIFARFSQDLFGDGEAFADALAVFITLG